MIVPVGAPSEAEAIRYGSEVFHAIGAILHERGLQTLVGDEGGYAPPLETPQQALDLMVAAIERAGYHAGRDVAIALDPASSEFYRDGNYYPLSRDRSASVDDMIALYADLCERYPIVSIEDGLAQSDWSGWQKLTQALGNRIQLVGDDIFVTNTKFLERGIKEGAANAILIKVNQIGTLTETLDCIGDGAEGRIRRRDFASLGRDRRYDHSRSGRRHQRRVRSRPARSRAASALRNIIVSRPSRRSWATPPVTREGRRTRAQTHHDRWEQAARRLEYASGRGL